jgi:hypothetical protein
LWIRKNASFRLNKIFKNMEFSALEWQNSNALIIFLSCQWITKQKMVTWSNGLVLSLEIELFYLRLQLYRVTFMLFAWMVPEIISSWAYVLRIKRFSRCRISCYKLRLGSKSFGRIPSRNKGFRRWVLCLPWYYIYHSFFEKNLQN